MRTWTFTDACGNSSTVSQNIIVNDNVAPTPPAAPADVTVTCASLVPAAAVLSATDNCGGSITGVPNDVVTPGSCVIRTQLCVPGRLLMLVATVQRYLKILL